MSVRGLYGHYGVNDMHTVHTGAKIMNVYVWLYLLVWISTRSISSTIEKVELHIDTNNKTKGAEITDTEIIHFSATYCWCHLWVRANL